MTSAKKPPRVVWVVVTEQGSPWSVHPTSAAAVHERQSYTDATDGIHRYILAEPKPKKRGKRTPTVTLTAADLRRLRACRRACTWERAATFVFWLSQRLDREKAAKKGRRK